MNNMAAIMGCTGYGGIYVHKEDTLQLYNIVIKSNMAAALGGGETHYYINGKVSKSIKTHHNHQHNEGAGLARCSLNGNRDSDAEPETYMKLFENTKDVTISIALKNVIFDYTEQQALASAELIISDNTFSRGGGIGTNGNLI